MKKNSLSRLVLKTLPLTLALFGSSAGADTILNFDALPAGQFHNIAIIQTFGDNTSVSSPGIAVTGIGTPDIDLTWSAVSATNSTATRWDYYYYQGPPQPEPWTAAQLNQSWVGDYHDLKFTAANNAKVVVKSFNFHGYYGILNITGTNYQERFTYNWNVLNSGTLASLANGTYSFLSDSNKNHAVNINYSGTNGQSLILRLTRVASTLGGGLDPIEVEGQGSDIAVDDITFAEEIGAAFPAVTFVSQADGLVNVDPHFSYRATISDGFQAQAVGNSVQLKLNGLTLNPTITKTGLVTTVRFEAGGLLRNGSSNRYTLTFSDTAANNYTNAVGFKVRYTSYEWRFTSGDLSAALGNGALDYADGGTAGLTTFGTTDGGTVPHIGGNPAKYMHVPAFADDLQGYLLSLNDTIPNPGNAGYVNSYTVLFDVLVPDSLNWLPFFNADPFNLNDADFYLAPDGSIGIGSGYSAAGLISPNTWYRIAFVSDQPANTQSYYINGANVKTRAADGLDGRWSLYSSLDAGADMLLFNEGDTSGIYTHELYVSSVAFTDRALTTAEAASLGDPRSAGILAPSFAPKPQVKIEASGSSAVVSWPTNYVGYALEQTTSIAAPQWQPVWGITNNAVVLTPGSSSRFFRLVQ